MTSVPRLLAKDGTMTSIYRKIPWHSKWEKRRKKAGNRDNSEEKLANGRRAKNSLI
jgi:hypothetical protein